MCAGVTARKWRWSRVATSLASSCSATAITDAVRHAQRETNVLAHQFDHASEISGHHIDLHQVTRRERLDEVDLGLSTYVLTDEIARLCYHVRRDEEIVCARFE